MRLPPDLTLANAVGIVTNPVIGVTNTTLLVAAPAAGSRIRLWFVTGACNAGTAAAALIMLSLRSPLATNRGFLSLQRTGSTTPTLALPGGFALPAATELRIADISDAASQPYSVTVGYTIEAIN